MVSVEAVCGVGRYLASLSPAKCTWSVLAWPPVEEIVKGPWNDCILKLATSKSVALIVFSIISMTVGVLLLVSEPYSSDIIWANLGRAFVVAAIVVPLLLRHQL